METEQLHWRKRLEQAASTAVPGSPAERWILLSLLLLASALRLWHLPHIPYTHDEISALLRVRFHSFSDLIAQGVAIDAHPAGVQVIEWIWTGLFGTGEAAVKLPFICFSVAALFFLYRFAASWSSPAAALMSVAFLGTIQYTVMYGQIARPYAAGFFTCAFLVDQLTRAIGGRRWAWTGAAIAAVLCGYVHHFTLLFAALAWLCFLPLATRQQRKPMLIAGGAALLLYAPHIPITLRQYGYKGVGQWLLPPEPDWLPKYVAWIFEYSVPLAIVTFSVSLTGWFRKFRAHGGSGGDSPFIALCLVLGLVPLAVGYGYSLWRAPVLQYSVVIFSFPFLVFPLFAGWRKLQPALLALLVLLIVGTAVHGLVSIRQHYAVFYRSKYEAIVRGLVEAAKHPGRLALVDVPAEIPGFYFRQWGVDSTRVPYINLRSRSTTFVDSLMRATNATSVFYGASTGTVPAKLSRVRTAFPFTAARHDQVEGQEFLLTAKPNGNRMNDRSHTSVIAPEAVLGEGWQAENKIPVVRDTTARFGMAPGTWDMTGHEFGLMFERSVYELSTGDNDILEASMDVAQAAPESGLKLVMELMEGDHRMAYSSSDVQAGPGRSMLLVAVPLSDLPQHGQGARLRVYAWNPGKQQARISSITVDVQTGNPWLYGFFQPLHGPLSWP